MMSSRRSPLWPYLLLLVGLFALTIAIPTWQTAAPSPRSAERPSVEQQSQNAATQRSLASVMVVRPAAAPTPAPQSTIASIGPVDDSQSIWRHPIGPHHAVRLVSRTAGRGRRSKNCRPASVHRPATNRRQTKFADRSCDRFSGHQHFGESIPDSRFFAEWQFKRCDEPRLAAKRHAELQPAAIGLEQQAASRGTSHHGRLACARSVADAA